MKIIIFGCCWVCVCVCVRGIEGKSICLNISLHLREIRDLYHKQRSDMYVMNTKAFQLNEWRSTLPRETAENSNAPLSSHRASSVS